MLAHPWSTADASRTAIKEAATVGTTLTMPPPASTTLGAAGPDDAADAGIEPPSPVHRLLLLRMVRVRVRVRAAVRVRVRVSSPNPNLTLTLTLTLTL